jgi:hypothetical protein
MEWVLGQVELADLCLKEQGSGAGGLTPAPCGRALVVSMTASVGRRPSAGRGGAAAAEGQHRHREARRRAPQHLVQLADRHLRVGEHLAEAGAADVHDVAAAHRQVGGRAIGADGLVADRHGVAGEMGRAHDVLQHDDDGREQRGKHGPEAGEASHGRWSPDRRQLRTGCPELFNN